MQELGLTIDYRCPACRSCQDCKNAPDTERVSLREEAEDQAMRDAVNIDYEKKKITCILPLRGEEHEFLSSNRATALKVLDSQCRKVQKDEEAKKAIIKSFYKLFDGGFAKKFDDLEENQKAEILKKKVNIKERKRVEKNNFVHTFPRSAFNSLAVFGIPCIALDCSKIIAASAEDFKKAMTERFQKTVQVCNQFKKAFKEEDIQRSSIEVKTKNKTIL